MPPADCAASRSSRERSSCSSALRRSRTSLCSARLPSRSFPLEAVSARSRCCTEATSSLNPAMISPTSSWDSAVIDSGAEASSRKWRIATATAPSGRVIARRAQTVSMMASMLTSTMTTARIVRERRTSASRSRKAASPCMRALASSVARVAEIWLICSFDCTTSARTCSMLRSTLRRATTSWKSDISWDAAVSWAASASCGSPSSAAASRSALRSRALPRRAFSPLRSFGPASPERRAVARSRYCACCCESWWRIVA